MIGTKHLSIAHGKRPDQEGRDQTEGWPGSCQLSRHRYLPSLGGQLGIRGSQTWSPSPASPSMCADFNVRKAISSSACIRARHGRVTTGILRFAQSAIYPNNKLRLPTDRVLATLDPPFSLPLLKVASGRAAPGEMLP